MAALRTFNGGTDGHCMANEEWIVEFQTFGVISGHLLLSKFLDN
jgi:hypothetical protein